MNEASTEALATLAAAAQILRTTATQIEGASGALRYELDPPPPPPAPAPEPPPNPPAPAPEPPPNPPAPPLPVPAGMRYRAQAETLFVSTLQPTIQGRLPGQLAWPLNKEGPTKDYVCGNGAWKWRNTGGDWVDADGVPQGPKPWHTQKLDSAAVGATATYDLDITAALKRVQAKRAAGELCHAAFLVKCLAPRLLSTHHGPDEPKLVLTGAGVESSEPTLYIGQAEQDVSGAGNEATKLPAFIEVRTPVEPFDTAAIRMSVKTVARNADPTATVWLLDPDLSLPPVEPGPVVVSGLIGQHDYRDDEPESVFFALPDGTPSWRTNHGAESNWSPDVVGAGAPDLSKYPYRNQGKWLGKNDHVSLVRSVDIPFGGPATGHGAIKIAYPRDPQAVEGGYAPRAGYLAAVMRMPLPAEHCGLLDEIYISYDMAWDVPAGDLDYLRLEDVVAVYTGPNNTGPKFSAWGGKCGIVATHDTTVGGFSESAGGPRGWNARMSWGFPATFEAGPKHGAMMCGTHLIDMAWNNAPGFAYAGAGPKGGGLGRVGNILFPRKWYRIETRLKLNSVNVPFMIPERGADGKPTGNMVPWTVVDPSTGRAEVQHCSPDGEMDVWVDGMRALSLRGLIFRSTPPWKRPAHVKPDGVLYPIRDLGVRELLLNEYEGGTTPNSKRFNRYYSRLRWGTSYVGPMPA